MKKALLASAVFGSCIAGSVAAYPGSLNLQVTAEVQPTLSVDCKADLRFGKVGIRGINGPASVSVEAVGGAVAYSTAPDDVIVIGDSGPAECTITGLSTASASLSADIGVFSGSNLSTTLVRGADSLTASLQLSKTSDISNETIYIGGTVLIPAAHSAYGTYTRIITLTVTD